MTAEFRHHPDGLIFINGRCFPLAFFQEQEPNYALPTGAIAREYIPGVRHTLSDGSSQWGGDLLWESGDRYLAKQDEYQAALELELNPPLSLEQLKAQKIAALDAICTTTIDSGFASSALGSPYRYSSQLADQFNLKSSRDIALELQTAVDYVCTDEAGVKAARSHTPEQINQVLFDGLALKRTLIFKFHTLRSQVEGATTVEAIAAVNW